MSGRTIGINKQIAPNESHYRCQSPAKVYGHPAKVQPKSSQTQKCPKTALLGLSETSDLPKWQIITNAPQTAWFERINQH